MSNSTLEKRILECPGCGDRYPLGSNEKRRIFCVHCGRVLSEDGTQDRLCARHQHETVNGSGRKTVKTTVADGLATAKMDQDEAVRISRHSSDEWLSIAGATDQSQSNFAHALYESTRIGLQLGLPEAVLERASELLNAAFVKGLTKGISIKDLAVAVLYAASRQDSIGIPFDEVAKVSGAGSRVARRRYRLLITRLNLSIPPPRLQDYLVRTASRLGADATLVQSATTILEVIERSIAIAGRDPRGIVAAATYLAARSLRRRITQRELSEITHVTEFTIRKNCRYFEKHLRFAGKTSFMSLF
jgi:transcription initiation factor TFIIB